MSDTTKIDQLNKAARDHALKALFRQAKELAVEYYKLTEKPLGITGEVAEYEAAEKLGLTLVAARTPFFDAYREVGGKTEHFQIKGRAVSMEDRYRGRVGKIKFAGEFDAVLLVLLDKSTFSAIEIWRAERAEVTARLTAPGGRARTERGQLAIRQFISTPGAQQVWPPKR